MNKLSNYELVIKREFEAPLQLLWDVHHDPEHLKHWWGPKGFNMETITMEFSPGGIFIYLLENEQGFKMYGKVIYNQINKPREVLFTNSFSDEHGNIIRHPMSDTWPLEISNVMTFKEIDKNNTLLTLKSRPMNASEKEIETYKGASESVKSGFSGTFNQLDNYLDKLLK